MVARRVHLQYLHIYIYYIDGITLATVATGTASTIIIYEYICRYRDVKFTGKQFSVNFTSTSSKFVNFLIYIYIFLGEFCKFILKCYFIPVTSLTT